MGAGPSEFQVWAWACERQNTEGAAVAQRYRGRRRGEEAEGLDAA
jgi:hypothetical protein